MITAAPLLPSSEESKRGAAIFDIDHTLISGSTAWYFLKKCLKERLVRKRLLLQVPAISIRYRYGTFNSDDISGKLFPLGGISRDKLQSIAFGPYRKKIISKIFPAARQAVEDERAKGRLVIFATSSLSLLVNPIVQELQADHLISSHLDYDENGICTGSLKGAAAFGRGKLHLVSRLLSELSIDPAASSFYSDSFHDLPLLEHIAEPHAVNPDRTLARVARKRMWHIHHFRL